MKHNKFMTAALSAISAIRPRTHWRKNRSRFSRQYLRQNRPSRLSRRSRRQNRRSILSPIESILSTSSKIDREMAAFPEVM